MVIHIEETRNRETKEQPHPVQLGEIDEDIGVTVEAWGTCEQWQHGRVPLPGVFKNLLKYFIAKIMAETGVSRGWSSREGCDGGL